MLCLIENYSSFSFLVKMEYAKSISLGSHVGGCPDFCNSYIIPSWLPFFFRNFDTSCRSYSVSAEKRIKFFCSALDFS